MSAGVANGRDNGSYDPASQGYAPYEIPSELLAPSAPSSEYSGMAPAEVSDDEVDPNPAPVSGEYVRGGWQGDEAAYYPSHPEEVFASNPYDSVRQTEYEQLHQQMYHQDYGEVLPQPQMSNDR